MTKMIIIVHIAILAESSWLTDFLVVHEKTGSLYVFDGLRRRVLNQTPAFSVARVAGCEATTDRRWLFGQLHRLLDVINGRCAVSP